MTNCTFIAAVEKNEIFSCARLTSNLRYLVPPYDVMHKKHSTHKIDNKKKKRN